MAAITETSQKKAKTIEDFDDDKWITAKVFYTFTNKKTKLLEGTSRIEIVNVETRERYRHEEMSTIALKAGILATMGIPFYAMANVVMHVARLGILTIAIFARSVVDLLSTGELKSLQKFIVTLPVELSVALCQTVWSLVKTPICALGMEFCAICAIISPIKWRVHLASVEALWRGTDRRHNLMDASRANQEWFGDFFTNPFSKYGFFIATCFQPWGTLDDSNICKNRDGSDRFIIQIPTA